MWGTLIGLLLQFGPSIFEDAEKVIASMAHGPGGAEKIANAAAAIGKLAEHVTNAAISAGHIQMPAGQSQPAAVRSTEVIQDAPIASEGDPGFVAPERPQPG